MIYAASVVWLYVIVLLAWAVYYHCTRIAQPNVVDVVLLPGTILARAGRFVALLITGATIDPPPPPGKEKPNPTARWTNAKSNVPVLGPMLLALLPMTALAGGLGLLIVSMGGSVVRRVPTDLMAQSLPITLSGFWDQLRGLVTLAERTLNAIRGADMATWRIALFAYVLTGLSARMAPLPGNTGAHLGVIVLLGVVMALVGTVIPVLPEWIARVWPVLAITAGWLVVLLILSLVARGSAIAVRRIVEAA